MAESDEPFLQRWSRRKSQTGHGKPVAGDGRGAGGASVQPADEIPQRVASLDTRTPRPGEGEARPSDGLDGERLAELARIDIDTLTYESDFTQFMQKGVPDELRTKALAKLWTSDPIFAVMDGLDDYCEDFSDAVWVDPALKTAYRIGRGFLSDDEVAAWDNLGKPAAQEDEPRESASPTDRVAHGVSVDDPASDGGEVQAPSAAGDLVQSEPIEPEVSAPQTANSQPDTALPHSRRTS